MLALILANQGCACHGTAVSHALADLNASELVGQRQRHGGDGRTLEPIALR